MRYQGKTGSVRHLSAIAIAVIVGFTVTRLLFAPAEEIEAEEDKSAELMQQRQYVYTGGPAIIFRMDDAERGVREYAIKAIVELFYENGVPLDVGIIPHANGRPSFRMPFLKSYLHKGIIDISIHAFYHTYREYDSSVSGKSYEALTANLAKARSEFKAYFGKAPIAFTVPYDVFNKVGYRAIRDAGLRIISSQWISEPHPSATPVDYEGNPDKNGMYRIPAVDDVVEWKPEQKQWGKVLSMSYLSYAVDTEIKKLGVAVLTIHPQSFDDNGRIDQTKLNKLDSVIKECKKIAQLITFEDWYESRQKEPIH